MLLTPKKNHFFEDELRFRVCTREEKRFEINLQTDGDLFKIPRNSR